MNVSEQINTVRRGVGTRALDTGQARVITLSRIFDREPTDVWDALTNIERIPRWFLPITGDLRLGGTYQLEDNANGRVEQCDPPKRFVATWEFGDQTSWIDVQVIAEAADQATVVLNHIADVDDEQWAEFGPGATGIGWDLGFLGLSRYLGADVGVDPADGPAWMASTEGREYITISAEMWLKAHLESGADPEAAKAAATRVTAAYTAS